MTKNYLWTDNPTEANVAVFDPDILNDCLMHLKYADTKLTRFCVNSASTDASGNPNLLNYSGATLSFRSGESILPIMSSNLQQTWTLSASHPTNTSANDIYKSFDNDGDGYCSLQHTPSDEEPAYVSIANTNNFTFDYLYLKFNSIYDSGAMKTFYIKDGEGNILFSYENFDSFMDKDTFLIPVFNFNDKELRIYTTSNVNGVGYVNFPSVIKLLDKAQVISLTSASGKTSQLCDLPPISIDTDGIYNIYLGTEGSMEISSGALSYGKILPTQPIEGQVHYLTSGEPASAKKYNGSLWVNYEKVPVGKVTVSGGVITSAVTNPYNQNNYNLNRNSFLQNLSAKGWCQIPGEFILQWDLSATGNNVLQNFPIAFPNELLGFAVVQRSTGDFNVCLTAYSSSQYKCYGYGQGGGPFSGAVTFGYIAIGY